MLVTNRLCQNCAHRQICKIKDEYADLAAYIDKSNIQVDDFHVNISCKNYLSSYNFSGFSELTKFGDN